jgi:hypothetical protein
MVTSLLMSHLPLFAQRSPSGIVSAMDHVPPAGSDHA